jgi:hypothetical protein
MRVLVRLLFLALAAIASAHAAPQDIVVRSKLDPATGAVPGQPVKLLVDVLFAGAMPRPPLVDVGEASGAQILRFETQAVTIREAIDGVDYVGQRFEFAVFARRGGQINIPAANVTVLDQSGDRTGSAKGQSLTLGVVAPPGLDMSGPVLAATKVTASETWTPDPATASFKPGGAVTRAITRRADGVPALGMAEFSFAAPPGVRVYADGPQSDDRVERGHVEGSRTDKVTYVFVKPGTYDIPALAQPWWDLQAKQARSETLPGVRVVVPDLANKGEGGGGIWRVGYAMLAIAGVGALALAFYLAPPRLVLLWRKRRERYEASEGWARRELRRIAKTGDALSTYRALEVWLHRLPQAADEAARGDVGFASLRRDLERALFGAGAEWTRAKGVKLASRADKLRRALRRRGLIRRVILPPLNPSSS